MYSLIFCREESSLDYLSRSDILAIELPPALTESFTKERLLLFGLIEFELAPPLAVNLRKELRPLLLDNTYGLACELSPLETLPVVVILN